ncbi:uncharacterized protein DUF4239 [Roseiarcus fermentans]|uniref:Uncharacterized protein DUF4239 n=1 Tax=Roseiarcus fermentans TaxID=1473586 RepID=A0A366FCC4_9HYPH|nr:DUF4239 domain-containing protein [Roseiarcus fermentans]RBP11355.1 uncharacterized protein DUF4239 [Roseiarcus fermentans]
MSSLSFAIGVAVLVFVAGLVGLTLRARLPEKHSPDRSAGMIGAMTGLLSLLLALVLGTFAGSAYGLYSTQKAELETLGARLMQLDSALEVYGPETRPAREALRKAVRQTYDDIWGGSGGAARSELAVTGIFASVKGLDQYVLSLSPKTDTQRQAFFSANGAVSDINRNRLLMALQISGGVPWAMLDIIVCWSLLMFCGYGLVSPINGTVIAALGFGALTIGSALFVIVELSDPFSGTFRLSAAPVQQTIEALGDVPVLSEGSN